MYRSAYVGIDIGTTNSVACLVFDTGEVKMVSAKNGSRLFPSRVVFKSNNTASISFSIMSIQSDIKNGNVVMNAKRIIGRKFNDEKVQKARASCKAEIRKMDDGYAAFYIPAWNRLVTPEEVYSIIINEIWKRVEEEARGVEIKGVTFTVPAEYKNEERVVIKRAIDASNVKCKYRILNEPCAASIAYGCNNTDLHQLA